jgi:hypothetical protein
MRTLSVTELAAAIGQQVYFNPNSGLSFLCMVKDAKISWGKPRFLIQPVSGKGTQWVEFSSISPIQQLPAPTVNYSNNVGFVRRA